MRLFLHLLQRFAAMTGNTVAMGFGYMFDTLVAADTGGLFCSTLATGEEDWQAKQEQQDDMAFAVNGSINEHFLEGAFIILPD
jgi:hypothetical protein